jgi:hypothetical protein
MCKEHDQPSKSGRNHLPSANAPRGAVRTNHDVVAARSRNVLIVGGAAIGAALLPLFGHFRESQAVASNDDARPGMLMPSQQGETIEYDNMKRVSRANGNRELFDVTARSQESRNLTSERPALARELSAELDKWLRSCPRYVSKPMPKNIRKYRCSKSEMDAMRGWGYVGAERPTDD